MTSTPQGSENATDLPNPLFARLYEHVLSRGERAKMTGCRQQLVDGVVGRVLEIGPGNGLGFGLYPATVDEVLAVEPEPYLRVRAERAAKHAAAGIVVVAGDAEHLPTGDASVDVVVVSLVLCSVPDQARALAEARRVLRSGGELRVFEHVIAEHPLGRAALRAAEATFWPRAFGNCHPARDTLAALTAAGFDTSRVRRFVMRAGTAEPPLPYILGTTVLRPTP
jgi:ubiquinone/menaquinone biosynthesis C-methylase UbiE